MQGPYKSNEIVTELFKTKLPEYLKVLKVEWEVTQHGQQTGLASPARQGPFDQAILKGEWNTEKFAQHGGENPIMGGAPGSRGIPEKWPYAKSRWVQVGHAKWKKIEPNSTTSEKQDSEEPKAQARLDWAGMDWTTPCNETDLNEQNAEIEQTGNRRLNSDGSSRPRVERKTATGKEAVG